MSEIVKLEEVDNLDKLVEKCVSLLRLDEVILVPTDTIYGLICLASSSVGVKKIYDMKERPSSKYLPIVVSSLEQLMKQFPIVDNIYIEKLAEKFWPGALTLVCEIAINKIKWLDDRVDIGVRVPDNKLIRRIASEVGPLCMTSANKSGEDTPNTVVGAMNSLLFSPSLLIDGGILKGDASTIVNVKTNNIKVEREGVISIEEINKVIS